MDITGLYIELEPDEVASKIGQDQLPLHWMVVHADELDVIVDLVRRVDAVLFPETFLGAELQLDDEDTGGLFKHDGQVLFSE